MDKANAAAQGGESLPRALELAKREGGSATDEQNRIGKGPLFGDVWADGAPFAIRRSVMLVQSVGE